MTALFPYQWEGAKWLASKERALLADEPGLGKTAQAIIAADLIGAEQMLIVPPASVREVWNAELKHFSMWGHDVHVFDSVEKYEAGPQRGVNVINYDLLARGFEKKSFQHNKTMKLWKEPIWDVLIADEAHFLKQAESLRTRGILAANGLAGRADRLWLLTGTPMPNHPGELWTILCALDATDLSDAEFQSRFCEMGGHGFSLNKPKGTKPGMEPMLNQLLGKVMMRRLKQFVMPELPPISVHDTPVPEVKINIAQFFEDALVDKILAMKKIKAQEEFVRGVWQTAIASGGAMDTMDMIAVLEGVGAGVGLYRRWLGAVKAVSFLPILLDELQNNAYPKVVIFAHHKQVIAYLKAKLAEYNPQVVDGSVSAAKRTKAIQTFQFDETARVFIGQTVAAGTGITLTAAHEVVVLEPDWVPSNNAQAIMRCHRIGQKFPVRARFIRLADTLDDYISETLSRKTRDIVRVLGDEEK